MSRGKEGPLGPLNPLNPSTRMQYISGNYHSLETDVPAISAGSRKLTQGPVVRIVEYYAFLRHDSGMHI